jgi:hypothetical protein
MVAVTEQELVEPAGTVRRELDAEVAQSPVGDRALREVVGDGVVPELFG